MGESNNDFGNCSEIKPYQFEPEHVTGFSDSEDGNSQSETTGKLHWALGTNDTEDGVSVRNVCPCQVV